MAAFSKDPEKVAACMDIVRSIYAGAGNELTGELPTSRSLRHAEGLPGADLQAVPRFLEHAEPRPGLSIYPSLSNEMQVAIGRVLTGSATPEQALDNAGERVEQTYELLSGGTDGRARLRTARAAPHARSTRSGCRSRSRGWRRCWPSPRCSSCGRC